MSDTGFSATLQQVTRIKYAIESDIHDIAWNLAAQTELPDNEFREELTTAIQEENEHDIEHIYMLLGMLYDPRSIKLVKENIDSATNEGITYAIELLDVFLSEDLKQKIIPILDDLSNSEKLKRLEIFFPREKLTEEMVLKQLINRDYNQTNRWTKAVTINQIGFLKIEQFRMDLIANLFNPDMMVKEIAAWSLYQIDPAEYEENIRRLAEEEQRHLNRVIVKDQTGQLLRFNKVRFLNSMPIFSRVPGITLTEVIDNAQLIELNKGDNFSLKLGEMEAFYILYAGKADFYINGQKKQTMERGYFTGEIVGESEYLTSYHMIAIEDTILLEISKDHFYELLSDDIQFANHISRYMETV